jgi:hypothetical protein
MIAMPYILVDIVLSILGLIFFCVTSTALLSTYPLASLYLPAPLRRRKAVVVLAHGLVVSALSITVVLVITRFGRVRIHSPVIADVSFLLGVMNAVVLAYRYTDRRYFLNTPALQRRLLLGAVSLVSSLVPVIAIVTAVVGLFTIR